MPTDSLELSILPSVFLAQGRATGGGSGSSMLGSTHTAVSSNGAERLWNFSTALERQISCSQSSRPLWDQLRCIGKVHAITDRQTSRIAGIKYRELLETCTDHCYEVFLLFGFLFVFKKPFLFKTSVLKSKHFIKVASEDTKSTWAPVFACP